MGWLSPADDDRVEYLIVASNRGKLHLETPENGVEMFAKARVFVMEDRTVAVALPSGEPGKVAWRYFVAASSTYSPPTKMLAVNLENGGILRLDGSGCGCGMGAVGNAGPVDGPYRLTPVRAPEWHSSAV